MKYKKITLKNGLRIIHVPVKGNPSATVMVLAEVGSKYETKRENGLAHFIEHMCFKGTKKRPSSGIVNKELDALGASSNAMTTEEFTVYYAKVERRHWKKILNVLSDIYLHPTFPKQDLEKERGVIIQEISMYEDLPQEKVAILFQKLLYGDTPVGRWIAGTKQSVSKLRHQDLINYHRKHYVAKGTMVVVSGDINEKEVKHEVEKLLGDISTSKKPNKKKVIEKQTKPQMLVYQKKTDQTHLVLGFRTFKANDKRQAALNVLAGILGRGMSSRLWHKMREELGACYYIHAASSEFTDHGYLSISTGINPKRAEEVIKTLLSECKKLTTDLVGVEELKKIKDYLVGHMYLRLETTNSQAMFYVAQEVAKTKTKIPSQVEKEIRSITARDIKSLAKDIFKTKNINLAIVGEVKNPTRLKKLLVI